MKNKKNKKLISRDFPNIIRKFMYVVVNVFE